MLSAELTDGERFGRKCVVATPSMAPHLLLGPETGLLAAIEDLTPDRWRAAWHIPGRAAQASGADVAAAAAARL